MLYVFLEQGRNSSLPNSNVLLSTASKYGVEVFEALKLAFTGKGTPILVIGGLNSYIIYFFLICFRGKDVF
jgi:hypothetical protein